MQFYVGMELLCLKTFFILLVISLMYKLLLLSLGILEHS